MLTYITTYLIIGIFVAEMAHRGLRGANITQYLMGCLIWPFIMLAVLLRILLRISR